MSDIVCSLLAGKEYKWVVTGAAGFIGSNLVKSLLGANQYVIGLDNFSTGHKINLEQIKSLATAEQWSRFAFIEGDIRNLEVCRQVCIGADFILHQAALGSVPRSIADPITSNESNVSGHLNMLVAAKDAAVKRFVYAASSSTYGDHPALPKVEERIGMPLSPYAVTKYVNELYAQVFERCYGIKSIGLRYFNVFGPRQDPDGVYAAVIPKWTAAMIKGQPIYINGDGETSRDFCYIDNVVQANIRAALADVSKFSERVFNVAVGQRTTLNELYREIASSLRDLGQSLSAQEPVYRDFREGDVRHSLASIERAERCLEYKPSHTLREGLKTAMRWYVDNLK